MSSSDPGRSVIGSTAGRLMGNIARLGMSPRQQMLNRYWASYRCQNYDARKLDWDGSPRAEPIEHEAIATAGFIPPGFYDAGGQMLPLKYRRPTAPYNLVKVIVDRFTGLLFSERRHPQLRVDGDSDTEDYAHALAEVSRLWPAMIQARTFGGATGTACVSFKFVNSRPLIEVHDPRWLRAEFVSRATLEVAALEERYMAPLEVYDRERGEYVQVPFWFRRLIDQERDILWKPQPVGDGEEPDWENPDTIEEEVQHGFGECPAQWVQNLPVVGDIDGDPDCHGIYDLVESIDALLSQANRGVIANCDPTVVISSTDRLDEVGKGSGTAIKLTNGDAKYLELAGSGPKAAREQAEDFRHKALEVAQCVLEHPDMANRTATEIERVYSSMLAKADVMREQYGERCVKPLLEKMIRAVREKTRPVAVGGGNIERGVIQLPDRVERKDSGEVARIARQLGPGGVLNLQWPGYFEPVLTDVSVAVDAATKAKAASLIDAEHATKFIADYFRVEDVQGMMDHINEETASREAQLANMSLAMLTGKTPGKTALQTTEMDVKAEQAGQEPPKQRGGFGRR